MPHQWSKSIMVTRRHDEWSYCDKGAQETIQICRKTGVSSISSSVHGTNSTKLYSFLHLCFYLPFTALIFLFLFASWFHHGYGRTSFASSKTPADSHKKTLNYRSCMWNIRLHLRHWLHSLMGCGNYVQLHHTPFHYLPTFINLCPNLLKKGHPLRIQQAFQEL